VGTTIQLFPRSLDPVDHLVVQHAHLSARFIIHLVHLTTCLALALSSQTARLLIACPDFLPESLA